MRLTDMQRMDDCVSFIRYETKIEEYSVVDGDQATWLERGCPTKQVTGPRQYMIPVTAFSEAQGVRFLCPKCTPEGHQHSIQISFEGRGVTPEQATIDSEGKPVYWKAEGTSLEDLTLRPSIWCKGPDCGWHGYVTNGDAI